MIRAHDLLGFVSGLAWPTLFALSSITAFELLLPRGRKQNLAESLPGTLFWLIWVPVSAVIHNSYHLLWAKLGIAPLVVLPLDMKWTGVLAAFLAPVAGAVMYDFFFYWAHRAQHRWFWRFHAVHHSIEDLSAVNSYHHISEPLFQTALILLPISLVGWNTGAASGIAVMMIYLQNSWIHSPTSFHFGPLRWLVDNRFHRIHHSLEEKHFDKNFGAFTTLWDRLFGTAWMPAKNEWPDTGLAEIRQPRSLRAWVSLPWRYSAENTPPTAASEARLTEPA